MNQVGRPLMVMGLIWLAAVLQTSLSQRLAIFGVAPDFSLAVLAPIALTGTLAGSTCAGFASGWIQGALAGANLGHYVVSRTVGTFLFGLVRFADLHIGPGMAALITAGFTLFARLGLLFLAPPPSIGGYLGATIGMAMYNGVIATPIYILLVRMARRST